MREPGAPVRRPPRGGRKVQTSIVEQRAHDLLQSLFGTFQADVPVHGFARPSHLDGIFTGVFRGRQGRWIVDISSSRAFDTPTKIALLARTFREFGDQKYDGVLIVLADNPADRPQIMERLQGTFPNKTVQIVTLSELELMSAFDDLSMSYPGPVATLGHNSDQYKDAIEAIAAVSHRLASSNTTGLKADVRDRLLVEVQAGRTLLEAATVRVAALANTIVPALKFIAENCAKAVVGELAKNALQSLIKLVF